MARWARSGLTADAFAAREKINPRTLTYWRWRLRTDTTTALPAPAAPAARFVELVVPPAVREAPVGVEIVLPVGYRVRVSDASASDMLRTVLDVLEARG